MRAAVLLALALAGCAGPLAAHRERVARTAVAHEPLSLRLVNGTLRLLASGTLGDERVAWALDTGATDHWLAAGRATGRVRIAMIDISQDAAPGVESVTTGPGIGGVLSPERLVSSGARWSSICPDARSIAWREPRPTARSPSSRAQARPS